MGKRAVVIFFTIFFSIYGSINYYIFIRGYQGLELVTELRVGYTILFIFVASSYLLCRFIERRSINALTVVLFWIGSFWFGYILYFFLSILLLDAFRLANHFTGMLMLGHQSYVLLKFWLTSGLVATISVAMFLGYRNARRIRIKTFSLTIDKENTEAKQLTVVMASDIHLGTIVAKGRLQHIVQTINALKPDLILLPGDILDSEIAPVVWLDLGATLRELSALYGVYAVTGNHEYIGGITDAVAYIREHRIDLLRDEVREVAGLVIVGREDYTIRKYRKSLDEILANADRSKPMILMDHQPFHLEEAEHAGIDLQVSGHTHRGQLWPLNYITKRVYELDWGFQEERYDPRLRLIGGWYLGTAREDRQ
jgi:predicted MPP superfamily phosphohydrolase